MSTPTPPRWLTRFPAWEPVTYRLLAEERQIACAVAGDCDGDHAPDAHDAEHPHVRMILDQIARAGLVDPALRERYAELPAPLRDAALAASAVTPDPRMTPGVVGREVMRVLNRVRRGKPRGPVEEMWHAALTTPTWVPPEADLDGEGYQIDPPLADVERVSVAAPAGSGLTLNFAYRRYGSPPRIADIMAVTAIIRHVGLGQVRRVNVSASGYTPDSRGWLHIPLWPDAVPDDDTLLLRPWEFVLLFDHAAEGLCY